MVFIKCLCDNFAYRISVDVHDVLVRADPAERLPGHTVLEKGLRKGGEAEVLDDHHEILHRNIFQWHR